MIFIDSHKKKEETLRRLYPIAVLIDVTSHATDQWQQLSPFYPHYGIPVPFSPEVTAACVEGVWQEEVELVQWVEPVCNQSWTRLNMAFDYVRHLLEEWLMDHAGQECYPPTVIHITDGEFNGTTRESLVQQANEIKSMFTPDGNVLLWNIHIIPTHDQVTAFLPTSKNEVYNSYSALLYDLSSLLPTRYNADIAKLKQTDGATRHVAMAENTDLTTLVQLMDIGTPTNINQNV